MKTLKRFPNEMATTSMAILLTMVSFVCPSLAQTTFTRITTGPIATDSNQSTGCAWGDYDNDGYLDLFVTSFDRIANNVLYHNERNGTFTRFSAGAPGNESNLRSAGCAWADFDNDGALDLFVTNLGVDATNWLYRNNGNGTFEKMTELQVGSMVSDPSSRSVSAAWGDFDADGYIDLFVANGALAENKVNALFHNLGQGGFKDIAEESGIREVLKSTQGTWADVDGDGRLDLFVTHNDGQGNYIYRNLGGGAFHAISSGNVLNERLNSLGSAWGDYDNDGDLDLIVVNGALDESQTPNAFYQNKGNGIFEKIKRGVIADDSGKFRSCAWADYDNDGFLDLFITNEELGNRLYHNKGDGTFERVQKGSIVTDIANSDGCAWGDYDNDGFLDLFVANGSLSGEQRNFLYHNNGNTNHWIKVRCVGTVSNRSAIGAIVRAQAMIKGAVRQQMRQISGGDGWISQNSLDVSIGFGEATNIDLLRIEWPSGIVQEFQNVPVNQTLVVEEPSRIQSFKVDGSEYTLVLKGGRLRRYDIEASNDLVSWSVLSNGVVTNVDGIATVRGKLSEARHLFYRSRSSVSTWY